MIFFLFCLIQQGNINISLILPRDTTTASCQKAKKKKQKCKINFIDGMDIDIFTPTTTRPFAHP